MAKRAKQVKVVLGGDGKIRAVDLAEGVELVVVDESGSVGQVRYGVGESGRVFKETVTREEAGS